MSQRSLRQKPRITYFEPEEPSLDEYVFCEKCADYVFEYCSIHGALLVIPDDKVPAKSKFPSFVPRAALTIPHVFLHLNYSTIPGAGLGVFASVTLPCGVRFGPYRGERARGAASDYSWQIYDRNNKPSHALDAADGDRSNWMRYVNCARRWREQNLLAFQYRRQLYYRTIRIIPRFTELMVFYGTEYANILQIDLGKYNSPRSYAQKFGAPTPKKSKFGVECKKLQHRAVSEPFEGNKESNNSGTNNSTAKLSTVEQETSKNIKKSTEIKTQSRKGATRNKKRKIGAVDIILHPQDNSSKPLEENTSISDLNTNISDESEPGNVVCKKLKTQKVSNVMKRRFRKNTKTTEKEKNVESKNLTSVNTDDATHVDDKAALSISSFEKENISLNNGRHRIYQIPRKKQNVKHINIEDVYYFCDVCKYRAVTEDSLKKHMWFHDINRAFLCETCSYRFPTSFQLYNHKLKYHGIKLCNVKIHESNICDYTTIAKNSLKIHSGSHCGEILYLCHICDYKCSQVGHLKIHLRTHTGERPYSCDICDYKCSQVGHLKIHLRTHTGERPYSCDICDYKCSQVGHLKIHLRTHTGEKPYSCDICDYKCSQVGYLKIHLRTHTGERPYSCDICDYKFLQVGDLKRHLRTHTGEKPYSCDICDYKFMQVGNLKRHLRTHTGEKPYSCDICDYKCSQVGYLKIHFKKIHLKQS